MKRMVGIVLVLMAASVAHAQDSDRDIFSQAEARFRNENYDLALERYETLIRQYPTSSMVPDAQFRRAVVLYRLNRAADALEALGRVETRYRSTRFLDFVPYWKGLSHYALGDFAAAAAELERFADVAAPAAGGHEPVADSALFFLGMARRQVGDTIGAIAALGQLMAGLSSPGEQPYTLTVLLSLYVAMNNFPAVLALVERVAVDDLDDQWATRVRLFQAEALFARGDEQGAEGLFDGLRTAEPEIASRAYQRLFQIYQRRADEQRLNAIIRGAEQALANRTDILKEFWLRIGVESFERGEVALADYYLQRVWDVRNSERISGIVPQYLAEIAASRGETERARSVLLEFLRLRPDETDQRELIVSRLIALYAEAGQWVELADWAQVFLAEYPASAFAAAVSYQFAFALYRLRRPQDALAVITDRRSRGQTGEYNGPFLRLESVIRLERAELDEAVTLLRAYTPTAASDVPARLDYLNVLFRTGRFQALLDEVAAFDRAVPNLEAADRPASLQVRYLRALALLSLGNFGESLVVLNALPAADAVGDYPEYAQIWEYVLYYRGWAAYREGLYSDAIKGFTDLLDVNSGHEFAARSAYLAGWSSFLSRDYQSAEGFLLGVETLEPSPEQFIEARFLLGKTYLAQRRYRDAADTFRSIHEGFPDSGYAGDAMYEHAGALIAVGQLEAGLAQYSQVYTQRPTGSLAPLALYRRGEALFDDDQFFRARTAFFEYRQAYPREPLYDAALYWGGAAAAAAGAPAGALLLWDRLISEFRDSFFRPRAMEQAAALYRERGELRMALRLFTELITLFPDYARSINAQATAEQLQAAVGALPDREAALWVEIENRGRAATAPGRLAILELSRIIVYETTPLLEKHQLIMPLLEETQTKDDEDPAAAAQAVFLSAEYYARNNERVRAAELFLRAADLFPENPDQTARSLMRAAEMFRAQGQNGPLRQTVERITAAFPATEWVVRAQNLQEAAR